MTGPGLLLVVGVVVLFGYVVRYLWAERTERRGYSRDREARLRQHRIAGLERELGIGQDDAPTPSCGCAVVVNDGLHGYVCPDVLDDDDLVVAEFDGDASRTGLWGPTVNEARARAGLPPAPPPMMDDPHIVEWFRR